MIRVLVELWPLGREKFRRVLGIASIANDGVRSRSTAGRRGSYTVELSKWAPKEDQVWKKGRVADFDRKRRGPWDLLFLGLESIVGKRNQGTRDDVLQGLRAQAARVLAGDGKPNGQLKRFARLVLDCCDEATAPDDEPSLALFDGRVNDETDDMPTGHYEDCDCEKCVEAAERLYPDGG